MAEDLDVAEVHQDIHAALTVCNFNDAGIRNRIINNKGFQSLADFGILDSDKDVLEMVKRLGSRTEAAGRVFVGTIQVKKLQALCYWVRDHQKRGQVINHEEWDEQAVQATLEMMRIEKGREAGNLSVKDLGKFDPDDFETYEMAFMNLLAQTYGSNKESLKYIVRASVVPAAFTDEAERRMFQLPLTGNTFVEDNKVVYRLLKSFLVNTPGWTWIEGFDATENGRGAFQAWSDHYNGQGELSKRTALAKAKIDKLFYRNEGSLSFERVMEILTKAFSTLEKDPDEAYSERRKVDKLLAVIQSSDVEVVAQKSVIASQFPNDFTGACNYFSAQVSRLHGGAQLESRKYKKRNVSAMHGRGGRDGGRGGGRARRGNRDGRHGGRGGGGRPAGRGGRGQTNNTLINGVDVSDPTRGFTEEEWGRLAWNGGRQYVNQARERINNRGGRGGRVGRDGRGGNRSYGGGHNVSSAGLERDNEQVQEGPDPQQNGNTDRGAQHGRGFGRGAYQRN